MEIANAEDFGFSRARLARLEARMQEYVDQKKLAGIVTLVARRNQVVHCHATGKADIQADLPMRQDTLFRIYSMTKPITSVAVLMLFEEGLLRLQDPVAQYIPAFKDVKVLDHSEAGEGKRVDPSRPITIHDLLTHTGGLSHGLEEAHPIDKLYRQHVWGAMADPDLSLAELVARIADQPLVHHPGTQFRYSMATDVLGYLVEVVSGMPFDIFLKTRIFEPLGMKDTGFRVKPDQEEHLAVVYSGDGAGGLKAIDSHRMTPAQRSEAAPDEVIRAILRIRGMNNLPSGGGGLFSTASDYLQFTLMLANNGEWKGVRILGRKTVELMTTNGLSREMCESNKPLSGFGLGVSVLLSLEGSPMLGSAGMYGWGGAANTSFSIDPKEELILLFLSQHMPASEHPAIADFQTLVYQALVD